MYQVCPKCGHDAGPGAGGAVSCGACGLVYRKWMKQRFAGAGREVEAAAGRTDARPAGWGRALLARVLHVEERVNPFHFWGRAVVLAGLAAWSVWFLGTDFLRMVGPVPEINTSCLHRVDLVFHEAGHVLFRPFGEFMHILGGSLGQLLMPLVVGVVFLVRSANPFGASVGMWWLGQSAMDLAPYIADARAGRIMLLGGVTGRDQPGYHDWGNLLGRLGWLQHDHAIAAAVDLAGRGLVLLALAWGGWLLYRQWPRVDQ